MSERRGRARIARIAVACAALGWAALASGQLAPRLSAQVALDELAAAQKALSSAAPSPRLAQVRQDLDALAAAVRKSAGGDLSKPQELAGDAARARIARAHAAASRVQSYLEASGGCLQADLAAMQEALALGVAQLAQDGSTAKVVPVIDSVQTIDSHPLFARHAGPGPWAIALVGEQLTDLQCANPQVSATDAQGRPLAVQPTVTGTSPARVELRWADASALAAGSVVLHLATQHKVFLLGCTALPPAQAVVQVAAPIQFDVDYVLEAVCPGQGGDGIVALGKGRLPTLRGAGATVSQPVDTSACAEPQAYRLTAGVTQADGHRTAVGPFTQSAEASMTAGLPGGLTMSWNPAAQALFVRSGTASCRGVP